MKKLVFSTITILMMVDSSSVQAAGPLTSNKIEKVSFNTGGLFLHASGWPNPNSCTGTGAVVLLETDPNYDKAYALILAAYMAGKSISGYSNGCAEHDGKTYNTIRGYKYLVVQ